jgi:hypothetical protein
MSDFNLLQDRPVGEARHKAVYTFIFGDYDSLKPPAVLTPGWDYICFTDDPTLRSDVWDVRLSARDQGDIRLGNKKYAGKHKILFHRYLKDYDLSLSMAADVELNCNLDDLMRNYFRDGDDMMICRHDVRDCIYDEAEVCKTLALDDPERVDEQMQRYRGLGYPAHNGLYSSGIIARWHDRPNVQEMTELWWQEYLAGSRRDQLSLPFALWRSVPIKISVVDYDQQFLRDANFIVHPHKPRNHFHGTQIRFSADSTNGRRRLLILIGAGADYIGQVDEANRYGIRGWAADRNRLNTSIIVSLYEGNECIVTLLADKPRPDVGAHLGDNGLHGFTIPLPKNLKDGRVHNISVRFETSGRALTIAATEVTSPGSPS